MPPACTEQSASHYELQPPQYYRKRCANPNKVILLFNINYLHETKNNIYRAICMLGLTEQGILHDSRGHYGRLGFSQAKKEGPEGPSFLLLSDAAIKRPKPWQQLRL